MEETVRSPQAKFNATTAAIQGSGWGWLGFDKAAGKIKIATCANQDPLMASHGLVICSPWLARGCCAPIGASCHAGPAAWCRRLGTCILFAVQECPTGVPQADLAGPPPHDFTSRHRVGIAPHHSCSIASMCPSHSVCCLQPKVVQSCLCVCLDHQLEGCRGTSSCCQVSTIQLVWLIVEQACCSVDIRATNYQHFSSLNIVPATSFLLQDRGNRILSRIRSLVCAPWRHGIRGASETGEGVGFGTAPEDAGTHSHAGTDWVCHTHSHRPQAQRTDA